MCHMRNQPKSIEWEHLSCYSSILNRCYFLSPIFHSCLIPWFYWFNNCANHRYVTHSHIILMIGTRCVWQSMKKKVYLQWMNDEANGRKLRTEHSQMHWSWWIEWTTCQKHNPLWRHHFSHLNRLHTSLIKFILCYD